MNIVYIHGNRQTADSFNFIRTQITGHQEVVLSYDSANGFYNNHEAMLKELDGVDDIFFVAHSLGGIHAMHLADELSDKVLGGVTLSTPYGGSEAAQVIKYLMPFNQVLKDIHPRSGPIMKASRFQIQHPWTNLVSTGGDSPLMLTANDGVVTHNSMRSRNDINLVEVDSNHFEIVLNPATVTIIKKAIADIETGFHGSQVAACCHNLSKAGHHAALSVRCRC
jgi:pimeloyl-ACP methyl ester carboxylesterase